MIYIGFWSTFRSLYKRYRICILSGKNEEAADMSGEATETYINSTGTGEKRSFSNGGGGGNQFTDEGINTS